MTVAPALFNFSFFTMIAYDGTGKYAQSTPSA
jgi:hypothetical protein